MADTLHEPAPQVSGVDREGQALVETTGFEPNGSGGPSPLDPSWSPSEPNSPFVSAPVSAALPIDAAPVSVAAP
ncbi:MAG: hypothetical protein QOE64_1051, partial [Frankiales bacterium]|nr:hypothetical protein [Frankiales bacterium]